MPGAEDGYPAGLEIGRRVIAAGTSTDDGTRIWVGERGGPARVVYAHAEDAGVGALSHDETLLAISHSEHGDSRHPAVRVVRTSDGSPVAEKSDGPGRGLTPLAFAPVLGDHRLLMLHERRGREELLVWDVAAGTETELVLDLPGELAADFTPAADALLVWHTHAARTRLHRFDLASGALTELRDGARLCGLGATCRPTAASSTPSSSAAEPPDRPGAAAGRHRRRPDRPARGACARFGAGRRPLGGRAGRTGARAVARPDAGSGPVADDREPARRAARRRRRSFLGGPRTVGGRRVRRRRGQLPRLHRLRRSGWRDAIEGRPGLTELEDVAAVLDACVAQGIADPARVVVEGWSWGGYLALLAAGTQPHRWAGAIAGVPVADYLTAYADEMEQLRAFDRALFGGSPVERPETYRSSSPLTYVAAVTAPVLLLAGENDPRCPIRQIENYLDALAARGAAYEVSRFDAGHGSLVVEETMRHAATEVAFARRACCRTGDVQQTCASAGGSSS